MQARSWLIWPVAILIVAWLCATALQLSILIDDRQQDGLHYCRYLAATGFETRVFADSAPCARIESWVLF